MHCSVAPVHIRKLFQNPSEVKYTHQQVCVCACVRVCVCMGSGGGGGGGGGGGVKR